MSRYDEGLTAPKTLTDRETALLLRTTGERRGGFRDHLLFSMALGTALREHELVALDMRDVYDDEGTPRRRVVLRTFKRSNPDRNMQQVLLNETVRAKLVKYRGWKMRHGEAVDGDAPVFVSRHGKRLSTRPGPPAHSRVARPRGGRGEPQLPRPASQRDNQPLPGPSVHQGGGALRSPEEHALRRPLHPHQ